ncbi:glutamine amidotransferase class-II [Colletotrichum graminicola]|uniref:Glutamine amidotransferase class-II n=1 Tax=Colletotrichum graminicola (strain M1.001 / M2 / FGSC 10212) TaxID=645133 RepID=E3QS82_COLGM|nr:glutamine amidotransferase class-II [Colletotrichum graminicola M1.001]EFQ33821.1 glutamine amidotransferase class-II [Colletotrichum graminicola M1.001]WDK21098.1 glutamine amidotransferase class-II [Colletotrichum graminicola]
MCRWFAYLGDEPQLLEDVVIRPRHAIVKQIDAHFLPAGHTRVQPSLGELQVAPLAANNAGSPNALTNMDGFGVGWFTSSECDFKQYRDSKWPESLRPVVYKSIRPPLNDLVLKSIVRGTSSNAVLAHIRAAPGLTPVVETNCHPIRTAILQYLPLEYQQAIVGTTDAEHIAAVYFFILCGKDGNWELVYDAKDMAVAMRETIVLLEKMQTEFRPAEREFNTLNLVTMSGSSLLAVRYGSPKGLQPPSLYYSTTAGATLNRKYKGFPSDISGSGDGDAEEDGRLEKTSHGKHVVVASEPSTFNESEWELVEPSQMVVADISTGVHVEHL